MKELTRGTTFFLKRVFPIAWFACLLGMMFMIYRNPVNTLGVFAYVGPVLVMAIGFFALRRYVWDLADNVEDHGDFLRVRRGNLEDRIYLADITHVSATRLVNPPRITLHLAKTSKFGDAVTFSPTHHFALNPFAPNPIETDLATRIEKAKRALR